MDMPGQMKKDHLNKLIELKGEYKKIFIFDASYFGTAGIFDNMQTDAYKAQTQQIQKILLYL